MKTYKKVEMTALGNSRTLLPVEYPLSSLTSWSDAAAAAAVGYNYPSSGSSAAHQLVYGGGRLVSGPHPYACPGGGTLGVPPESSCSMYSTWRHHAHHSPLSLYYQPDADWILRQSKLESQPHPFSHHHHQQLQQQQPGQRWKSLSDSTVPPSTTSSSTANRPSSISSLQFDLPRSGSSASVGLADNASHDGSSGSCAAGLSPVMDAWTTTGRSSVTISDQYRCLGQGQVRQDTRAAPSQTGLSLRLTERCCG